MSVVSIIVPVYNVELYLPKCIDSILTQSYRNFELILINDGSIDGSGLICLNYSCQDKRIKYISQENKGVSAARNRGLKEVTNEFVIFIDSDDYVEKDYLLHLITGNESFDLVVTGIRNVYFEMGRVEDQIPESFEAYRITDIGKIYYSLDLNHLLSGVYLKLFKTSLLQQFDIYFNPLYSYGEDIIFVLQYLQCISNLKVVPFAEYNYMHRNADSLSKKRYSFEIESAWCKDMYTLQTKTIKRFSVNSKSYQHYYKERYMQYYLAAIYSMYLPKTEKINSERLRILSDMYKDESLKEFSIFFSKSIMSIISLLLFKIGMPIISDKFYQLRFRK